jgi:hypothetical protein
MIRAIFLRLRRRSITHSAEHMVEQMVASMVNKTGTNTGNNKGNKAVERMRGSLGPDAEASSE